MSLYDFNPLTWTDAQWFVFLSDLAFFSFGYWGARLVNGYR